MAEPHGDWQQPDVLNLQQCECPRRIRAPWTSRKRIGAESL